MRTLLKSGVGRGILAVAIGVVLVLGTESWRWLGAIGVLGGLVLVLMGPSGVTPGEGAATRGCRPDHSCCAPRELERETSARRLRHRQACH